MAAYPTTRALSYEDSRILKCPAFPWNGDLKACRACNAGLTGRQQRWCSPGCQNFYGRNHFWTWAREARLEADGFVCVRCSDGPGRPRPQRWHFGGREGHLRYKEAIAIWKLSTPVEVNHVWPLAQQAPVKVWGDRTRKRKHADSGCHHHLSLLMTLCRPCHRRITNQQFGLGKPKPVKPPPQIERLAV